jgi:hypothetical protein
MIGTILVETRRERRPKHNTIISEGGHVPLGVSRFTAWDVAFHHKTNALRNMVIIYAVLWILPTVIRVLMWA